MAVRQKTNRTKAKASHLAILETREFLGTYSYPKPQQIPRGAAQASLNFLTKGTWVELRPGYHPLGDEVSGAGKCLGYFTAHKWDGTEVPFKATLDGKLSYFDGTTWHEVGSNILAGAAAVGENVYMDEYFSPAGAQLWISSPSSDLIKIMVANPGSYLSQFNPNKNFKGRMRIIQNSMWMWHYIVSSTVSNVISQATKSTVQRSYIDSQAYQTQTDNNTALGTSVGPTTITGTLTKNSVTAATVFGVVITDTDTPSEIFTDDYLGHLIGSLGGVGTINYSTGAFSITPKNAPVSPSLSATYSYEDSTAGGIADFSKSSTRAAGQGVAWIQNNGGDILGVNPYNGSYYILHQRNAWVITPTADDTGATNVIYRDNIYLAGERGSVATADGVYYIDDHSNGMRDVTDSSRPFIGLLTYNPIASQVLPVDLSSDILDLSVYDFDQCFAIRALDYVLFFCRTTDSSQNNRCIAYNTKLSSKKMRIFDILDYEANCAGIYGGQIMGADSISNNVYKLFDGFDDNNGLINATWIGNQDDHGIPGLKQTKKLWAEGYIAVNQSVDVYVQLDANTAVKMGTISGSGNYIDQGQAVTIGSLQIGVYPIGGPSDSPIAFHYLIQITINSQKYKYFTISFVPTAIGYFSFQMYANYDIRVNVDKLPQKYRDRPSQNLIITGPGNSLETDTLVGVQAGSDVTLNLTLLTHPFQSVIVIFKNGQALNQSGWSVSGNTATVFNSDASDVFMVEYIYSKSLIPSQARSLAVEPLTPTQAGANITLDTSLLSHIPVSIQIVFRNGQGIAPSSYAIVNGIITVYNADSTEVFMVQYTYY